MGAGFTLTGNTSSRFSVDFNPVVDRLRVVTCSCQNDRVNPIDGTLLTHDASLLDDVDTPLISDVSYSNYFVGATETTLYAWECFADTMGIIGSLNGTPDSNNGGPYTVLGDSGIVTFIAAAGLDISGATGVAYFGADNNDRATAATVLYTVNLSTGALTWAGDLPFAAIDISVMTPVSEPATWGLMLLWLGAISRSLAVRRRAG